MNSAVTLYRSRDGGGGSACSSPTSGRPSPFPPTCDTCPNCGSSLGRPPPNREREDEEESAYLGSVANLSTNSPIMVSASTTAAAAPTLPSNHFKQLAIEYRVARIEQSENEEREAEDRKAERKRGRSNSTMHSSQPHLDKIAFNMGYYKRFFKEQCKLGSGGFGAAFLCRHILHGVDLGNHAVKKIPLGDNPQWLQRTLKEVKVLESLHHPNIISYRHAWIEEGQPADFGPLVPCLYILMEYANGGNLASRIWPRGSMIRPAVMEEERIQAYLLDIVSGMTYMHRLGFVHGDIKLENLLLSTSGRAGLREEREHILIADFGQCRDMQSDSRNFNNFFRFFQQNEKNLTMLDVGYTGTMQYTAPELLRSSDGDLTSIPSKKSDVWSLGIVLYALAFGTLPFLLNETTMDFDELRNSIVEHELLSLPAVPERSEDLKVLILSMLDSCAALRPTSAEVMANSFLSNDRGGQRSSQADGGLYFGNEQRYQRNESLSEQQDYVTANPSRDNRHMSQQGKKSLCLASRSLQRSPQLSSGRLSLPPPADLSNEEAFTEYSVPSAGTMLASITHLSTRAQEWSSVSIASTFARVGLDTLCTLTGLYVVSACDSPPTALQPLLLSIIFSTMLRTRDFYRPSSVVILVGLLWALLWENLFSPAISVTPETPMLSAVMLGVALGQIAINYLFQHGRLRY